jgi:hypothetical protein
VGNFILKRGSYIKMATVHTKFMPWYVCTRNVQVYRQRGCTAVCTFFVYMSQARAAVVYSLNCCANFIVASKLKMFPPFSVRQFVRMIYTVDWWEASCRNAREYNMNWWLSINNILLKLRFRFDFIFIFSKRSWWHLDSCMTTRLTEVIVTDRPKWKCCIRSCNGQR